MHRCGVAPDLIALWSFLTGNDTAVMPTCGETQAWRDGDATHTHGAASTEERGQSVAVHTNTAQARISTHSGRNMTNTAGIHHMGLWCLWLYYPARLLPLIVRSHTLGR